MEEDQKKLAIAALEVEAAVMQHSYPSPTEASVSDQHFYQQLTQRNHDMDPAHEQLMQQALANLTEHQGQQNQDNQDETYRLLRTLQEESSEGQVHGQQPSQQIQQMQHDHHEHPRPHETVDNADDLRLAAQLSEAVAPMLAQNHSQEQVQPPPPPPGPQEDIQMGNAQSQEQVTQDLGQQLQAQLQSHDRELQNILPHEQSQSAEPEYPHQQHEHQPDGLPSQLPPLTLTPYHHAQFQLPDNTPPRKRSKVSRACDECRRKKIKCDAQADTVDQGPPCSNCKRASVQCLFSRVPQKRGPSKGYIKELADRIHTIEGKLGGSVEAVLESARRTPVDVFAPTQSIEDSRKRSHSSISGDVFSTPQSTAGRPAIWSGDRPRPLRPQPHPDFANSFSVNDLAPTAAPALAPKQVTPTALPVDDFSALARPDAPVPEGLANDLSQPPVPRTDLLDEAGFEWYLLSIHRVLPVLGNDRSHVEALLSQCPTALQEVFMSAFHDLLRPFIAHVSQTNGVHPGATHQLLNQWEVAARPKSRAVDLVELQALVMIALGSDHEGPGGQSDSRLKIISITKAVALAYSMGLHLARPPADPTPEFDRNSDQHVALRAWWTLISFDRWDAFATGRLAIVNNDAAVILPGLQHIVGETVYQFHRFSDFIGTMVPIARSPPEGDQHSVMARHFSSLMTRTLGDLRLQFPSNLNPTEHPHLHLSYWHTALLCDLFTPTRLHFMLQDCARIVHLLLDNANTLFPLTHHFLALVSIVLTELIKVDETHEEATELVKRLTERDIAPSVWVAQIREKTIETLRSVSQPVKDQSIETKGNVKMLQQLADLATAVDPTQEGAPPPPPQDSGPPSPPPLPAGVVPNPAGAQVEETQENHFADGGSGSYVFDPRTVLKPGYLAVFTN